MLLQSANSTSVFVQTLMYVMNQSAVQQQQSSYNYYYIDSGKAANASQCYGSYGCFQLSPPWTSEHRPVAVFPEEIKKIEPTYWFYSRKNPTVAKILDLNDFDFVKSVGMDPNLPLFTVTHGFLEGGDRAWIKRMAEELLINQDCNVIAIDWSGGSGPPYTQAVANIRLVGAMTAHLLADIARHTGDKQLKHVHAIGHSLGAHLSAYTGYTLQKDFNLKLGRITGMDPAEPHFAKAKPPVRLDRSAADYVDVIHTDASAFILGGLGITEKIGHVDYYPNGGTNQPGCSQSVARYISSESGSFFRGMRKFLGCNHIRSHEYFLESINSNCSYMTISCNSYEDFQSGKCFECGKYGQHCMRFGFDGREHYKKLIENKLIQPHHNLIQYSMTSDQTPYCRAHYRITVDLSNSTESKQHGGEVGQLLVTMHSTRDGGKGGDGESSGKVTLTEERYHGPGARYTGVVAAQAISHLKTVEIEWKFTSNILNPLTWRLLQNPRIYVSKVNVRTLETEQSVTVCPKDDKALVSGIPQLLMASYCP